MSSQLKLTYPLIVDYYNKAEVDSKDQALLVNFYTQLVTTSGDLVTQIPIDYITHVELTTASGDIVAQFPSLAGYATQTWVNDGFISNEELTTTSGDIVVQIPSLTGYATETWVSDGFISDSELTTTSGDIISQIPSLTGYATESWVSDGFISNAELATTSGDIIDQLPSLAGYATESWVELGFISNTELTTTSGDIVDQIPSLTGYATESWTNDNFIGTSEFTTSSGDIVSQIPSLAGYATESWVELGFISNTEITTISGDIIAQIQAGGVTLEQLVTTSGDIVAQIDASGVTDEELTTTSGDIVSQIPSLTGYATEGWVADGFISNAEMTTISGDIVSQIGEPGGGVTLEQLTTTSGDIVAQIDSSGVTEEELVTTSGDIVAQITGGSLPEASAGALLVGKIDTTWDVTTTGKFLAASGTLTDGLEVGNIYIEPNEIIFPDGSEATTARSLVTCTGTVITETFTLNYNDTYPKDLFVLPANCEVISVAVTVVSGFSGGYGYENYPELATLGAGTGGYNTTAGNTNMYDMGAVLIPGWWVVQFGLYSLNSQVIKPKYGKRAGTGSAYTGFESITAITVSGGTTSFTKTAGSYWQNIDIFVVPLTNTYSFGYYSVAAAVNARSAAAYTSYGLKETVKTGDLTGTQVGFAAANYGMHVSVRYAVSYYVGDELDNDSIVTEFTPSIYTTVSGLSTGAGWSPQLSSRQIKIYRRQAVADSSGQMQITIQYREHCFDDLLIPTFSGGENIYVERTNYNNWIISSATPCYQSLCQRYINTEMSTAEWPVRLTLLPANHILQSMTITTSGLSGGYGSTAGSYNWGNTTNLAGVTFVNRTFQLTNGAAISKIWFWSPVAGTLVFKIAKEFSTSAFELSSDDFMGGARTHSGLGEQVYNITPVTVSGVGSDIFRIAVVFYAGWTLNLYQNASYTSYWKSGGITGYSSGSWTSTSYHTNIIVGYVPSLSVGTDTETTKFISTITTDSGSASMVGTYGPVTAVTPITLNLKTNSLEPPTGGSVRLLYSYYNPDSIKYNRGYGLTWSGTGGTEIFHNYGVLNHTMYITPNDLNAGSWWVTKGANTDIVYSDTLSGTGSFDWFIQV